MKNAFDVIVLGAGPGAAAAARMLRSLEIDTLLVTPPAEKSDLTRIPSILLPSSALSALAPLGLRETIESAGTALRTHEIRWPGPEAAEVPGRSTGVQISEPLLRESLLAVTAESGIEIREARDVKIFYVDSDDGPAVSGVRVDPGGLIETRIVLCGLAAALPPACRPRAAGPNDRASVRFLKSVDPERFPSGHHYVACAPDSWWWALRDPNDYVQLTHFTSDVDQTGDRQRRTDSDESVWEAPGNPFVSAEGVSTLGRRDATPSLPGAGPWPLGLFAIGSALYRVAPVSSLGTAQALRGARAAVAAAHTILASSIGVRDAVNWFVDASTMRAARTHALTAEVCRQPLERFGSPFWRERATDVWALDVPEPIANAARAARRSLAMASDGTVSTVAMNPAKNLEVTRTFEERGPKIVEQKAVLASDGRPVNARLWQQLSTYARAFGVRDPLSGDQDVPAKPVTSLGELLATGDSRFTDDPKRTRRAVGALVEAGILTLGK